MSPQKIFWVALFFFIFIFARSGFLSPCLGFYDFILSHDFTVKEYQTVAVDLHKVNGKGTPH